MTIELTCPACALPLPPFSALPPGVRALWCWCPRCGVERCWRVRWSRHRPARVLGVA